MQNLIQLISTLARLWSDFKSYVELDRSYQKQVCKMQINEYENMQIGKVKVYNVICNLARISIKQDLWLLYFILKTKENKQN